MQVTSSSGQIALLLFVGLMCNYMMRTNINIALVEMTNVNNTYGPYCNWTGVSIYIYLSIYPFIYLSIYLYIYLLSRFDSVIISNRSPIISAQSAVNVPLWQGKGDTLYMYNGFLDYGGGDDPVDNQKNAEGFVKSAFFFGYFLTQVQMVTFFSQ